MILLSALATAILLWWLLKAGLRADPARLSRLIKQVGGAVALVVALVLLVRGRIDMAVLLGGAGAALLGGAGVALPFGIGRRRERPARIARARSATVEIEWDGRTGRIGGTVLAGPFVGRPLDSLSPVELNGLLELCAGADRDGFALLEAYLDRRFPGRREHAERDPQARPRSDLQGGPMTQEEAYEVLGLQPGAPDGDIRQAHRQLMKRLHPDGGGSTYLASRVNQAKDVLLGRHR